MGKPINLDHDTGTIYTKDDLVLYLTENGGIKIGDGSNLTATMGAGIIRYNDGTGQLELSDGTVWTVIGEPVDSAEILIWGIVF